MNYCTLSNNEIKIDFFEDLDIQHKVMTLQGRTCKNGWYAPVKINNLNMLKDWGFTMDENLQKFIDKTLQREKEIESIPSDLYPFQKTAVAFIETQRGKCLIGDEQGLGKTIETLSWLNLHRDCIPVVIVCPASLKLNWERETKKWLSNSKIEILKGTKAYETTEEILILNYDILHAWEKVLRKRNPQVLILDEATAIKRIKQREQKQLRNLKKSRILLD